MTTKGRRRLHRKKKLILPIVILAVLCICIAELIACRYFAPKYYHQITVPIRQAIDAMEMFAQRSIDNVSAFLDATIVQKETPENQLAGSPALTSDFPISDPSVTELKDIGGQQILTGGVVQTIYFNQSDALWADQPYGSDNIGHYGCGPTVMVMAVNSMTHQISDPVHMAQWAVDHGYWARKTGSYLSIVEGTATSFGLQVESITDLTPEAIRDALLSGKLLVALMGPGHFTNGGHFILLRGITLSGDVLVADPNSTERSLTTWDPQLILDELSASTAHGAPLWTLSTTAP